MTENAPPNKELNRLRAAAGIIPVIEAGLNDGKLTNERAALMAEFCLWSLEHSTNGNPVADKLILQIKDGLERIRARFELGNCDID